MKAAPAAINLLPSHSHRDSYEGAIPSIVIGVLLGLRTGCRMAGLDARRPDSKPRPSQSVLEVTPIRPNWAICAHLCSYESRPSCAPIRRSACFPPGEKAGLKIAA